MTSQKTYRHVVKQAGDRSFTFTISDGGVDTVDPNGWDLTNYARNKIVLWAHDYTRPPGEVRGGHPVPPFRNPVAT